MKPNWNLNNFIIAILLLLTTSMTNADELSGHIGGIVGMKTLNSSDWPDLNTHFSMGVMFDIKKDSWPISAALDIVDTGDKHENNGTKALGHTTEYHLGARKIFMKRNSKIQPYIGGGVSFMYAEQEYQANGETTTQNDRDVGSWLGAGMYYEINPKFVLGLDVRYSYGKVFLFNKERNAGGIHTGATVGFQF